MKLNLGDNIRKYRKKADMTQGQLANRLGTTDQSVSRWENGSTYPDMELLPVLAKLFNTTTDELLGIPDEKKEEAAVETFIKLQQAIDVENSVDTNKVVELIRDIRQNHLDSKEFWRFWNIDRDVFRQKDILPEVRLTVEAILDKSNNSHQRNYAIFYMSECEDDEHIDKFLNLYSSHTDLSKDNLLLKRYLRRNDWEKYEPLRQRKLFDFIDSFIICNNLLWRTPDKKNDVSESLYLNTMKIDFLHRICMQTPDKSHPISGNGIVDGWVGQRIWLGIRQACYMAQMGNSVEAYLILDDVVALLEKAMSLPDKTELNYSSPWLGITIQIAEGWCDLDVPELEARLRYIHQPGRAFPIAPSDCYRVLTAREGWEWFDPIRGDSRYQEYVDRVKALIVTRPKSK